MKKLILATLALPLLLANSSCEQEKSAEQKQSAKTRQFQDEADRQIGMPAIVNFQERRMMKDLYEKRDTKIATHSYIVNSLKGCLVYLGASVGYGIPYATQFTNPTKLAYKGTDGITTVAQPEPNGLYMPDNAHGTWIMLLNPVTKTADPIYVEPDVIVSPFKLNTQECK